MRKLIYSINLTIDGCFDHTKVDGSEEIHEYFTNLILNAGLLVYGRITYELMVPYWPEIARNNSGQTKSTNDFAQAFDAIDKVVFSKTMEKADDKRTRIVRTPPQEEIPRLKQQEGKDMLLGGVAFPSQLIALGLVDEYIFVVHPVLAGDGRRLFEGTDLPQKLPLKLVDSTVFRSGPVALRYTRG
jgi:dihydrofolate reductase